MNEVKYVNVELSIEIDDLKVLVQIMYDLHVEIQEVIDTYREAHKHSMTDAKSDTIGSLINKKRISNNVYESLQHQQNYYV